jgi:hypothetical protein
MDADASEGADQHTQSTTDALTSSYIFFMDCFCGADKLTGGIFAVLTDYGIV